MLATIAAFAVSGAWIAISATGHKTAVGRCLKDFFATTDPAGPSSLGKTMCDIFPWADVGIMGGLWVILAITQVSFLGIR